MKTITGISAEEPLARLIDTFKNDYDTRGCLETSPYADVSVTLPRLVDLGLRLFIATNKRLVPTRTILSHFEWDPYFSGIYTVDSAGSEVRDKIALVSNIVRAERLETSRTAMVGDSSEDAHAAAHSSLAFFAALWGYGSIGLTAGKDRMLSSFSELWDELKR
jgi:phosphoglycolate phosphatase